MTSDSKWRECYDNIIIKSNQEMCIHINGIHEIIMFVMSKQLTHTWQWQWLVWLSITALKFVLVDEKEAIFACIVDRICDKLKQKPWIVTVYWSL